MTKDTIFDKGDTISVENYRQEKYIIDDNFKFKTGEILSLRLFGP